MLCHTETGQTRNNAGVIPCAGVISMQSFRITQKHIHVVRSTLATPTRHDHVIISENNPQTRNLVTFYITLKRADREQTWPYVPPHESYHQLHQHYIRLISRHLSFKADMYNSFGNYMYIMLV